MLNENALRDEWEAVGNSYEDFKGLLTDLSDCTKFVRVNPAEVTVLSLASLDENYAHFYELLPCYAGAPQKIQGRRLSLQRVLEKGDHAKLMDETFSRVGTLFFADENVFFPAEKIMTRGMVNFGGGGTAMGTPSYERDLYISRLFKDARKCTFIVREIANVKKLVAILSAKYQALPQSALCEIIEALRGVTDFGEMKTYRWVINNWTSSIYVEFPEKAAELRDYYELRDDFVPGLWLMTSDTGESSVQIYPTWRHGSSISFIEKAGVRRVHSGKVELSDIIEKVVEKAFAEYTRMPEALCSLMRQNITDDAWDVTTTKGARQNQKAIEEAIKAAFKALNITKAIGKGYEKNLREQLCAEISGKIRYTAYDIATMIMSLPERLEGVNKETLHKLESAVAGAPYITYCPKVEDLILV